MSTREDDPDALARWLQISHLLANAQEMAPRGGAWLSVALVTADMASEAILGLLAAPGPKPPPDRATWEDVYEGAIAALKEADSNLPHTLRTRLQRFHRQRNQALHHGSNPSRPDVQAAIETARHLLKLAAATSESLRAFEEAGPTGAVARLVGIEDIASGLSAAGEHLRAGDIVEAVDQAAFALHHALNRVTPSIRPLFPLRPNFNYRGRLAGDRNTDRLLALIEKDLQDAFKFVDERASRQEAWLLATALGMQPAELDKLRGILGSPLFTLSDDPPRVHRDGSITLTPTDADWALSLTTDIIFRLWQGGGLRPGSRWEEELGRGSAPST